MSAKSSSLILGLLIVVVLFAHLITATHYPMFRDEFYYLDCANHLDWGYVDHPPLSIALLAGWRGLVGDSLFAVRFLPAIAAVLLIWVTWKLTAELGGNLFARVLAGVAALFSTQQRALTGFYSMNAFDLLFWSAAIWIVIRIIKTDDARLWIPFGIITGLGLMNKISLLFFGAGLIAGMLLTPLRRHFTRPQFWIGGGIAALIFLPYVLWQTSHEWATLQFMHNATAYKNVAFAPHQFLLEFALENSPLTSLIWGTGLIALLAWPRFRPYRVLGWMAAVVFAVLMTQHGKPYYAAGLLPLLLAAGAVIIESITATRGWRWARAAFLFLLVVTGALLLPFGLRILSAPQLVTYMSIVQPPMQPSERGHFGSVLPQHFSDSFGWEEMTERVAHVFHALPANQQRDCVIIASGYGETGAINYYGRRLGLPHAYAAQNSCYFWGPPAVTDSTTFIVLLEHDTPPIAALDSFQLAAVHDHPFAMPQECGVRILVGRLPNIPVAALWRAEKEFQ